MYIYMEEMAIHSIILAWRIPWTEEPSGLQSMGVTDLDTTEQLSMHAHICLLITIGILITIRKVVENMRLPKYHSVQAVSGNTHSGATSERDVGELLYLWEALQVDIYMYVCI